MFLKECVKIADSDIKVSLHETFPFIWSVKHKQSKETKLPVYYKLYCVCVYFSLPDVMEEYQGTLHPEKNYTSAH